LTRQRPASHLLGKSMRIFAPQEIILQDICKITDDIVTETRTHGFPVVRYMHGFGDYRAKDVHTAGPAECHSKGPVKCGEEEEF